MQRAVPISQQSGLNGQESDFYLCVLQKLVLDGREVRFGRDLGFSVCGYV